MRNTFSFQAINVNWTTIHCGIHEMANWVKKNLKDERKNKWDCWRANASRVAHSIIKSTTLYLNRQSVQFQYNDYYYKQQGVNLFFIIGFFHRLLSAKYTQMLTAHANQSIFISQLSAAYSKCKYKLEPLASGTRISLPITRCTIMMYLGQPHTA